MPHVIIKVMSLSKGYTVVYWNRILSLPLYYNILLVIILLIIIIIIVVVYVKGHPSSTFDSG